MRIECIGGGPGGLYAALLAKKRLPGATVRVTERNRADDTFGWGVVFSDETLGAFEEADPESYAAIREAFAYWTDIDTWHEGRWIRSTGHGFCGMSRRLLLQILQRRCEEVGVELAFEAEIDPEDLPEADLVIAADGINSAIRGRFADHFQPSLDWRRAKFTWLGTTKPLDAFTFVFKKTEHGVFSVHAYPFQRGEEQLSTWIVECHEDTWRSAGLEDCTEEETAARMQELFAEFLDGHPLLTNRSMWRTFPTVRCERWHHGNVVLLGDAVHTAHFSIGSGTKLAMESAIALVDALEEHGSEGVPAALAAYEDARRIDVLKIQKAAQTSLEWFEDVDRHARLAPEPFVFSLMTRSKRITWENLALRDPALVDATREDFWQRRALPVPASGRAPEPLFAPLELRGRTLPNRIVVSPMCQYSAVDGTPNDWHVVHLGGLAVGGAGLVFTEATAVRADGRITPGCTGLYTDEHTAAWRRITDFAHANGAGLMGIQIGHAGRKASCSSPWEGDAPLTEGAWPTLGPTDTPFRPHWPAPRAMDRADMDAMLEDFVATTRRAVEAGFDVLELHMAHGYLLSSFLSPASNDRTDAYGGPREGRQRFPLEVFEACRAVWPEDRPLFVRVSATDWLGDEGQTIEDTVAFAHALKERGCDALDLSSAGNVPTSRPEYGRMYQTPFAERVRSETGLVTMAVGAIQGPDHANTILAAERADLIAMARPHLLDPHLAMQAAVRYGHTDLAWPPQYLAVKPRG